MSKYGLLIELFQALSNYFSPSRIQKAACLLREGHEDIFLKHNVKETQSCGLQSTFLISTFVYGGEKMGFNCKTRVPAVGSPLKKNPTTSTLVSGVRAAQRFAPAYSPLF